jgi:Transposase, Mutator family/Type IV secretion-system coupling protein DNA-binding domain
VEVSLAGAAQGGRSADRVNRRNGYRMRDWETRAGMIPIAIPKPRKGSYLPSFLDPRRASRKALVAGESRPARCKADHLGCPRGSQGRVQRAPSRPFGSSPTNFRSCLASRTFSTFLDLGRSQGVIAVLGVHDVAQLRASYGRERADAAMIGTQFITRINAGRGAETSLSLVLALTRSS